MKSKFLRSFFRALILLFVAVLWHGFGHAKSKVPKGHDITDTIYANPILSSFAKLLQASPDIYTFLSSRGPFTVFVPTDSAFAKLPPGELDALLDRKTRNGAMHILLFHVIKGKRLTVKELLPLRAMFSCEGNPLTFRLTHSGVDLVQKAKVTHADIHCANGNINEIDTVLMPPELAMPPLKTAPDATPANRAAATNAPATQRPRPDIARRAPCATAIARTRVPVAQRGKPSRLAVGANRPSRLRTSFNSSMVLSSVPSIGTISRLHACA